MGSLFDFSQPEVCAAWIGALGGLLPALVATAAASGITWRINKNAELKARLVECQKDLEFLLEVEKLHCSVHRSMSKESFKNRIREDVRVRGFVWSGNHTPGKLR